MRIWIVAVLLLLSGSSFAQLRLVPLQGPVAPPAPRLKAGAPNAAQRTATSQAAALELPFWDDFSYRGYLPDAAKWTPNSKSGAPHGVTISYGVAIDPPSWGVASFDGVNPNDATQSSAKTDVLMSVPINLGALSDTEKPGVFLSFFWQLQGRGNRPDSRDSLHLYFIDEQLDSIRVWGKGSSSTIDISKFYQEMISLQDAGIKHKTNFLHPKFQMFFKSENTPGSAYDQWNLDYVYLDKGRDPNSDYFYYYKDAAISSINPLMFGPYTHMPIGEFMRDPAAYLQPRELFTAFSFLKPQVETLYKYKIDIRSERDESVFNIESAFSNTQTGLYFAGQTYFVEKPTKNLSASDIEPLGHRDSLFLTTTVTLIPPENFTPTPLFFRNDTITFQNNLHDYYAYDDGSAEFGVTLGNRGHRMAYRFVLGEQDTLTDVLIHFPKAPNEPGAAFNLKIWTALAGQNGATEDDLRYSQFVSVPTEHGPLNAFTRIPLKHPLVLPKGEIFIGYEQLTTGQLNIGHDLNTDSSPHIFYSTGTTDWSVYTTKGSLMIRPRFANKVLPESLSLSDADFPQLKIYPNPTQDRLWVESEADALRLYDSQGRLLLQQGASPRSQLSLGHLQPGLYLLQLQYKKGIQSKRIILVK